MDQDDIVDSLKRIEEKLDAYLERITAVESRVVAHELVAGALVALIGLGLGIAAVVR